MRRTAVASCLALAALVGMTFWAWPRPRPNLLLITLDTTRADRLGCYGIRGDGPPFSTSWLELRARARSSGK